MRNSIFPCRNRISSCVRHGTGWALEDEFIQRSNVQNMLAQLNSVYEVGRLWERHHAERQYSAVIYARPDVNFTCPFPAVMIDNIKVKTSF